MRDRARARARPSVLLGTLPGRRRRRGVPPRDRVRLPLHPVGHGAAARGGGAAPAGPDGVRRPADPACRASSTAFIDLFNAAFAEHATPMQMDALDVARRGRAVLGSPATLVVLEEAGRDGPAHRASASTDIGRRPDEEPRAEIWTLGVRPEHAGPRPGPRAAPLGRPPPAERAATLPVTLSVNGRNEGALRLYEREGFRPHAHPRPLGTPGRVTVRGSMTFLHRAPAADAARRVDVHRVLGDLLSLVGREPGDRRGLPRALRPAVPGRRRVRRVAPPRPDERPDDPAVAARRRVLHGRPADLAPRDRVRRRRAWRPCWATSRWWSSRSPRGSLFGERPRRRS